MIDFVGRSHFLLASRSLKGRCASVVLEPRLHFSIDDGVTQSSFVMEDNDES